MLAIIGNIYFFINVDNFDSISTEGVRYYNGTFEFVEGVKQLKNSLIFSGSLAVTASVFSIWKIFNRMKNLR